MLRDPMLCHLDWSEVIAAAEAAGRWSARQLACRCSPWQLGRLGRVWIRVEPLSSPVTSWLYRHDYGQLAASGHGICVPVALEPGELAPADEPVTKARSLLVAHSYCTVLATEAGATATPLVDQLHVLPQPHPTATRTDPVGRLPSRAPETIGIAVTTGD